jgi:hypothetical protein
MNASWAIVTKPKTAGGKGQDQVDEAGEVDDLQGVADGERPPRVRILQHTGEPEEAASDHDRPDPVLGPRPPREQSAADERPSNQERKRCTRDLRPICAASPAIQTVPAPAASPARPSTISFAFIPT